MAIEEWASERKNAAGDPLDMILLANQELDSYHDDNNAMAETKMVNSSIQIDRAQRAGMVRMLIDDNSGTVKH